MNGSNLFYLAERKKLYGTQSRSPLVYKKNRSVSCDEGMQIAIRRPPEPQKLSPLVERSDVGISEKSLEQVEFSRAQSARRLSVLSKKMSFFFGLF
ncbi:hypothetical protein ACHWQZ_G004912 [Mnemiopsis leidyi]